MKRAALIAAVSAVTLLCAAPAGAKAAGAGLWWGARAGFAPDAPSRKSAQAKKSSERETKSSRDSDKAPLPPQGPLHIIVSIDKQRATLFADGQPFAITKISSGTASHPTPMGVFSVIQKRRHHVSNLYDAPMPFMHRITWSGSALHQGPLPGYPASHGCVRLPVEFAELLWKASKIGARIIITGDEVKPEPIEHARLDALSGLGSQAERTPDPATTSAVVKIADAGAMAFASASKRPAAPSAARAAEPAPVVSDAPAHVPIMPIVSVPADSAADAQATKALAVDGPPEAPVVLAAPRRVADEAPAPPAAATPAVAAPAAVAPAPIETPAKPVPAAPDQPTKISTSLERMRNEAKQSTPPTAPVKEVAKPAEIAAAPPVAAKPVEEIKAVSPSKPVDQQVAPVKEAVKPVEIAAAPPVAAKPVEEIKTTVSPSRPVEEAKPAAPIAVAPAPIVVAPKVPAPIIVEERPAPPPVNSAPAVTAALPPPAAPLPEASRRPVSLFVSLKDRKLYARKGMEPFFEMPISIAEPNQPLGTHVFTAMGEKVGGGLRWTVVSIPSKERRRAEFADDEKPRKKRDRETKKEPPAAEPLPGAAAALDRIVLPPEAMARIEGLVLPGASLIVSDNKLSDETNNSTEFIVMTR